VRLASRTSTSEGGTLLIDARPTGSYEDGHIPTALLLDFPTTLLRDPAGFTYLRDPEDLKRHIATQLGVDILNSVMNGDATVVNSWSLSIPQLSADAASACGGGLSAAINWLHLQSLGIDSRLYDEVSLSQQGVEGELICSPGAGTRLAPRPSASPVPTLCKAIETCGTDPPT
jgi:thiosulfate/3-mercaptopyruvate sulfurtransferase